MSIYVGAVQTYFLYYSRKSDVLSGQGGEGHSSFISYQYLNLRVRSPSIFLRIRKFEMQSFMYHSIGPIIKVRCIKRIIIRLKVPCDNVEKATAMA